MDTFAKTQVIWAETKDVRVPAGGDPTTLSKLRLELAAIIEDDPTLFHRYETVPALDHPLYGPDVLDCAAAAAAIAAVPALKYRLILWPSTDGKTLDTRDIAPLPPWDKADPASFELIGTFDVVDTGAKVAAFRQVAAAGEPRFVSLVTGTGLPAGTGVLAPRPVQRPPVSAQARWWGLRLAIASLVVFAIACTWSLSVGKVVRRAEGNFAVMDTASCSAKLDLTKPPDVTERTLFGLPAAWVPRPSASSSCLSKWQSAVEATLLSRSAATEPTESPAPASPSAQPNATQPPQQAVAPVAFLPRADSWWDRIEIFLAGLTLPERGLSFSLAMPTLLTMASIVLLATAAGLGVTGRPLGIFIDKRNRMSLTRVQFAVWLMIIMGGLTSLALFNTGFWGGELDRVRAGAAYVQAATGDDQLFQQFADKANKLLEFVPAMDGALWGLIGITAFTTVFSPALTNPSQPGGPPSTRRVQVLTNANPKDAKLADLVFGETEDSEGVVDTNRVQTVAITGLLAAIYLGLILESVRGIGGPTATSAISEGMQVFGDMPPAGGTFLTLLFASHAALLGGKFLAAVKK